MGRISAKKRVARTKQRSTTGPFGTSATDAAFNILFVNVNDDAVTDDEHESNIDQDELEDWERLELDLTQDMQAALAQLRWEEGADTHLRSLYTGK